MEKGKELLITAGYVSIYMILECIIAVGAVIVQTLFRKNMGEFGGTIWNGSRYEYNFLMYGLGIVIFAAASLWLMKKFDKHFRRIFSMGWERLLFVILILIWCVVICFAELMALIGTVIGLSNDLGPTELLLATIFGWPIVLFVFLSTNMLRRRKGALESQEREEQTRTKE